MKKFCILILLVIAEWTYAQKTNDTLREKMEYRIDEVVVTGTRNETDIRHLPMTVSVLGRKQIEQYNTPSLLPLLTEQIRIMNQRQYGRKTESQLFNKIQMQFDLEFNEPEATADSNEKEPGADDVNPRRKK